MNTHEHLLTVLAEECGEVAYEVHKALRFGLTDHSPHDATKTPNSERIAYELGDLLAVVELVVEAGLIPQPAINGQKRAKVDRFMTYARNSGALSK